MAPSTWLISGSSRGIGRGLVQEVLKRPQTTVFATVRDLASPAASSLNELEKGDGSRVIPVKLDVSSEADNHAAASTIRSHGITHLDVVVANAGVGAPITPILDQPMADFRTAFEANTLGPILLFQALEPLLAAAQNPRFFVSTSLIGSITHAENFSVPVSAYGVSKAGINWFLNKMHGEFPKIAFVPLHPGLVETELGTPFSDSTGMTAISVDESVKGYLQQIDNATRDGAGGKFVDYSGESIAW